MSFAFIAPPRQPGCRFFEFYFGGHHGWRSCSIICAGWRTLTLPKGNDGITQCDSVYMVRHPRGSYICTPVAVSGIAHTGQHINSFERCHPYARKSASQVLLSRKQLTLHATCRAPRGTSRLVRAMSVWSVKTRRAPSRHGRDARVYGM